MRRRPEGTGAGVPGCGRPCPGAGALPSGDAEAVFMAYGRQVAQWVDETIVTMGFPRLDHLGRPMRTPVDDSPASESTWRVRRQLRDPKSKFIEEVTAEVWRQFFLGVRSGHACLYHLRGLLHVIAERTTWKVGSDRAKRLLRERLGDGDERFDAESDAETPEESLLAAEERSRQSKALSIVQIEVAKLDPTTAALVRARHEDPPRPYESLAAELGMTVVAARKRYHDVTKRLRGRLA